MASNGVNHRGGASTPLMFSDTTWPGVGLPKPDNRIGPTSSIGYSAPVREISAYLAAGNGSIENCVRIRTGDCGTNYAHSASNLPGGIRFDVPKLSAERGP